MIIAAISSFFLRIKLELEDICFATRRDATVVPASFHKVNGMISGGKYAVFGVKHFKRNINCTISCDIRFDTLPLCKGTPATIPIILYSYIAVYTVWVGILG